jgi:hypothetical protein
VRRIIAIALLAPGLAGAACAEAPEMETRPLRSTDLPPPRDGNIAIQEELDAARRAGTLEAYDNFLERHRGHPLVRAARRERARIARRQNR